MEDNYGSISIKRIPVLRPLVSLIIGILIQYHFSVASIYLFSIAIISALILLSSFFLSFRFPKFYARAITISVILLFISVGGILTYYHTDKNDKSWIGNYYKQGMPLLLTIKEPPLPKQKSYKLLAKTEGILINHQWQTVEGNVLIYLKNGDTIPYISYGSQLLVTASLTPIEFSNNPGGFIYREYSALKHIFFQGFFT